MHIVENYNARVDKSYCYACECRWNKVLKKYDKPRTSIGRLEGNPPSFVPNNATIALFKMEVENPASLS